MVLAIIGAGEAALPIIAKAREMSVKTLAFARLGSAAQDTVDYFIEENYFDVDYMAKVCREYSVDGVMATSELTTEAAAKLAAKLGLPGNDITNGFAGKNKYVMRERAKLLESVRQPKYFLYKGRNLLSYPVVVKAVDSCGKRGVGIARNDKEFAERVRIAADNSTNGDVLVEEYLKGGKEYSIECLSYKGLHQIIQYTEKDSSGPPHFIETGHHQPADLSPGLKDKVGKATSDILSALGLDCGMAHLELKIIDGEIYFIEVGARAGGDHIADTLVGLSTDFDYYRAAIECSLNTYSYQDAHTVAYSGIYFHCKQNEQLADLFHKAEDAEWCVQNTVKDSTFFEVESNLGTSASGFFIYRSNHRITLLDK